MTIANPVYVDPAPRFTTPRVSWSAVFAGLMIALVTYLFLAMLGTAIGAGSIDAREAGNPLAGFGTSTGLWVAVSMLLALAVGTFVAGRAAPAKGVAAVAPGVASEMKDQLQKSGIDVDFGSLRQELETLLRQSGKPELNPEALKSQAGQAAQDGKATAGTAAAAPQAAGSDLGAFFDRLRQKAEPALDAADKEALVNIIVARTGKSRAEAEQIAANYEQTYNNAMAKVQQLKAQAEQKARDAGDAAAKGVSQAAWAGVGVLLLGFLVSAAGGFLGRRSARPSEAALIAA